MNIVMIHGMNQQGEAAETLKNRWVENLNAVSPGLINPANVTMPYFGGVLHKWARKHKPASQTMGAGLDDMDWLDAHEAEFLVEVIGEVCRARGIIEDDLGVALFGPEYRNDEMTVPMNSRSMRTVTRLARGVDNHLTPFGLLLANVIQNFRQAYVYLKAPEARKQIDEIVAPCLVTGPPIVLLTHSIGTIIAYLMLRDMQRAGNAPKVRLFVTLGSPLGVQAVRQEFGNPWAKPACITRWANFYDPADPLTLGRGLAYTFAAEIEDDGTVDNKGPLAHGIEGYLRHEGLATVLKSVLGHT